MNLKMELKDPNGWTTNIEQNVSSVVFIVTVSFLRFRYK
jgi:hypothetical protein